VIDVIAVVVNVERRAGAFVIATVRSPADEATAQKAVVHRNRQRQQLRQGCCRVFGELSESVAAKAFCPNRAAPHRADDSSPMRCAH
jgi:hypothetical protein